MPRRLLDQDRQRERRRQQLLQERLSRTAERMIADEIRSTSQQAAKRFSETGQIETPEDHQRRMNDLMRRFWRASIQAMGERILEALNEKKKALTQKEDAFEMYTEEYIQAYGAEKVRQVTQTTMDQIKKQVSEGRAEGLGQREIGKMIEERSPEISAHRAAVIARTETHSAGNYGAKKAADRSGVEAQREWIASNQPGRTRETHLNADGQIVGKDEPFTVGGHSLMYPGDSSGPADEVINCRCAVGYVIGDSFEDQPHKPGEVPERVRQRSNPKESVINRRSRIIRKRLDSDSEKEVRAFLSAVRNNPPNEFNQRQRRLLDNWVRGSKRKVSVEMKDAAIQEFNLSGIPYSVRDYNVSQDIVSQTRKDLRTVYQRTQDQFKRQGVETVRLYRGVKNNVAVSGSLESWTTSRKVAESFDGGGVFAEDVPVSQILTHKGAPGWKDGPFGDQEEYIVMR